VSEIENLSENRITQSDSALFAIDKQLRTENIPVIKRINQKIKVVVVRLLMHNSLRDRPDPTKLSSRVGPAGVN